jgi:hypothetical protein
LPRYGTGAAEIINSTPNIAPFGAKDKLEKLTRNQVKVHELLKKVMTTEVMVDKLMRVINSEPKTKSEWPKDAVPNLRLNCNMSFTKLINEINHKTPRKFNQSGIVEPLGVFGASTGMHSNFRALRRSDIEMLGTGINLYMKLLKYLGLLFLLITLISVPPNLVILSG